MWTINSLYRLFGWAGPKHAPKRRARGHSRSTTRWLRVESLEDRSLPSTVTWNNIAAPNGGNWSTPANWSTGHVPGPADDVQITNLNPGATITYNNSFSSTIRSLTTNLTGGGTLNLNITSGSLNAYTTAVLDGNTTVNLGGNGGLGGPANWTLNGPLNLTGGTIGGTGTFLVNGGMTLSGDTHDLYSGTLVIPATAAATWTGGNITMGFGEVLDNNGTFNVQTNGTVSSSQGGAVINNTGTFQLSQSTNTTTINSRFNNSGTVSVQTGTLVLDGGGTSSGNAQFRADAPATLAFAGTFLIGASSSISGSGNVLFTGFSSNFEMAGSYAITGSTEMAAGNADFIGSVASVGDTLTISGGSINFENNSVAATTGNFSGGELYGQGDVSITNLNWTGTVMAQAGSTTVTGRLMMSGGTKRLVSRTLNINAGANALWANGVISLENDATINNAGTFTVQTNDTLSASGELSNFNNLGSFIQSQQTNVTTIDTIFNNSGTVDVQTGTLVLAAGGQSSGSFEVDAPPPPTPAASLVFGGGTHWLSSTSSVFGDGGVVFSGSSIFTAVVAGSYAVNGSTQISGGYADFPGSVASVGSSLTVSGGTADFEANTINADTGVFSGGTLRGLGDVSFNMHLSWTGTTMAEPGSTTILPSASLTITGPTADLASRTLTIDAGAVAVWTATTSPIQLSDGAVINNAGEFHVQVGNTIQAQTYAEAFNNSGSLIKEQSSQPTSFNVLFNNSGSVQVNTGNLILASGGATSGTASFNTAPGTTLTFGGGVQWLNDGTTVTGAGTTAFASGTSYILGAYNVSGPTAVSGSTAVYFFSPASSGAFTNAATVVLSPSDPTTGLMVNGNYTQTGGETDLDGATLSANNVNLQGGSFFAQGTIDATTFTNAGTLDLGVPGTPGALQVNGDYVQMSTGVLDIQVGGSTPGVDYDQLAVSGSATLNGTLNVSRIDGYVPPHLSEYQIITFGSHMGPGFTTRNIDSHFGNPPLYDDMDVTLVAN